MATGYLSCWKMGRENLRSSPAIVYTGDKSLSGFHDVPESENQTNLAADAARSTQIDVFVSMLGENDQLSDPRFPDDRAMAVELPIMVSAR